MSQAILTIVGGLLLAAAGFLGNMYLQRRQALSESQKTLAKYTEPLLGAAYELQARFWNILENDFLVKYHTRGDSTQRAYAIDNTLYVVAQYFGWSEIVRRDLQFLNFSKTELTRKVAAAQQDIVEFFQDDDPERGRPFLLWRGEQRAIGELMIEEASDGSRCMGYAAFVKRLHQADSDPEFSTWLQRLEDDIEITATTRSPRLVALQHALVELVAAKVKIELVDGRRAAGVVVGPDRAGASEERPELRRPVARA